MLTHLWSHTFYRLDIGRDLSDLGSRGAAIKVLPGAPLIARFNWIRIPFLSSLSVGRISLFEAIDWSPQFFASYWPEATLSSLLVILNIRESMGEENTRKMKVKVFITKYLRWQHTILLYSIYQKEITRSSTHSKEGTP